MWSLPAWSRLTTCGKSRPWRGWAHMQTSSSFTSSSCEYWTVYPSSWTVLYSVSWGVVMFQWQRVWNRVSDLWANGDEHLWANSRYEIMKVKVRNKLNKSKHLGDFWVPGRRTPLPDHTVKNYMYQLCKSLEHMHRWAQKADLQCWYEPLMYVVVFQLWDLSQRREAWKHSDQGESQLCWGDVFIMDPHLRLIFAAKLPEARRLWLVSQHLLQAPAHRIHIDPLVQSPRVPPHWRLLQL